MPWNSRFLLFALLAPVLLRGAQDRIVSPVDPGRMSAIKGHMRPQITAASDRGPVDRSMELSYVTVLLKPAPGLDEFLANQQNPSAPEYHKWLTPEQFAARFGLTDNDVARITAWLRSQGLRVHDVARGHHWITFSGTAGQVGRALRTEIRRYSLDGEMHYANASEPSVPEALRGVVAGFVGLDDFRLKPQSIMAPAYNSGNSHYMAPEDFATIYNVMPLWQAGYDGAGQKIAVVGQTGINLSDIQAFRTRFGLPPNDPQPMLYGRNPGVTGDLGEAALDLEWSGAVARSATIIYAYSSDVMTAAQYAVDQNLAPVMTMSYGNCELWFTPEIRYIAQQANAQGITWLNSSGDSGAASCDRYAPTQQASKGARAHFPSSIPEITSVGGTTFDDTANPGAYWAKSNNSALASALSYIPEKAWNDTPASGALSSTGGGLSALYPKPVWQAGPGVPDDDARSQPDVSLSASLHDGYLTIFGGATYVSGGTSAGSPALAGIVALLNQYLLSQGVIGQAGLGNINPMLYRLAQAAPEMFHDVTAGDNKVPCVQGSPGCVDGLVGYAAGTGYDLATGLGSIDAYNLVTKWSTGAASTTTVTAAPAAVTLEDTVQLTATVSGGGTATPAGKVAFLANDDQLGSVTLSGTGTTATATLSVPALRVVAGNGTVSALYSGDSVLTPSAGAATVTLKVPASGSMVVPYVTPNPVFQSSNAERTEWDFVVGLSEKAGVATRLTRFAVDNDDYSAQIPAWFGTSAIRAKGSITAGLYEDQITPPQEKTLYFEGVDNDGTTWSRSLTVKFVGPAAPALFPAMKLTGSYSLMTDAQADPACRVSHRIALQETGGYLVKLTGLTVDGVDNSSQIQKIFGTTRLAPFGMLEGQMCWSGSTFGPGAQYSVTGVAETGEGVSAALAIPTSMLPAGGAASASPNLVSIPVTAASPAGTSALALKFGNAAAQWSISVLPGNNATGWLTVSPISGTGDAQVNVNVSGAGLSNGVYRAVLAVQSSGSDCAYSTVPVVLLVGASPGTEIKAVANNFSGKTAIAPGTMAAVYGTGLAPESASVLAPRVPLPFTLAGVSATVNGISAPLYYVSPGQLDVQIPYEAGAGPAVLAVNNNGQVAAFPFTISTTAPGIAAAADGTLFPASAAPGASYTIYITGDGDVAPFLATGAAPAASTALAKLPRPRLPVSVTVGGVAAPVTFVGIPSWGAGVTQVNFTIPAAPAGSQPVVVTVGGVASPAGKLNVGQ
jgi:uncharacterized protein (TIGR03437 family)